MLYFLYWNDYDYQTLQGVLFSKELPSIKSQNILIMWSCKVTWQIKYVISPPRPVAIKLGKMVSYCKEFPPVKSDNPLYRWSFEIT